MTGREVSSGRTERKEAGRLNDNGAARVQARGGSRLYRVWRELRRNHIALIGAIFIILLVGVALLAPVIAPYGPTEQNLLHRLQGPSRDHWMGTDQSGRDVFSRLAYGARISLFIGVAGTFGGVVLGTSIGLAAGYMGGWVDTLSMRVIDIMFAFPGVLLAILIVSIMGPSLLNLIVALAIWGTPVLSRIVRSVVFSLRAQAFVESARAIGATPLRIVVVHILPNSVAPIIVYATLGVAGSLLTAAGLGFLGLGVQPPTPEWGAMLSTGRQYLRDAPHLTTFPGLLIFATVLSLNLIGDALRDALDPRMGS